ncbi:MAG: hypothetical protein ABJN34_17115 [Litoreibacter sp.]|uniref:hypothetical protein n=1 Tax=Litoreibacter sp. TaxID=1969459 RepID=UPI003298BCDA
MTNSGIGYLSALRRLCVGHIVGPLGITVLTATGAHAGAWEEFETRCLMQFENQEPAIVDGLELIDTVDGVTRYLIEKNGDVVSYLGIESEPDDGLSACYIQENSTRSAEAFSKWIAERVDLERYAATDDNVWSSQLWIEPVIELHLQENGDALVIRIVETELET